MIVARPSWGYRSLFGRSRFGDPWANEQNKHNRNGRSAGEEAEGHGQRHVMISQRAESPVRKSAATDADKIHDAIARSPKMWPRDLAENRHIVRVKKSPAQSKQYQKSDRNAQRLRKSHPEQSRNDEAHHDRTDKNSPPLRTPHPPICEPPTGQSSKHRRDIDKQRGRHARPSLANPETLLQNRRH